MCNDIRLSINEHFSKNGLQISKPNGYVTRLLKKAMGKKRAEQWELLHTKYEMGRASKADLYRFLQNAQEIHLAFSFQWELTIENHHWLANKLSSTYQNGMSIGELGCCTGLFVGWLALQYPASTIVGFDSLSSLISIAKSSVDRPNAHFELWDYRLPYSVDMKKLDCLVSAFGVDFVEKDNLHHQTAPEKITSSSFYLECKNEASEYFRSWRDAINDNGYLFISLRVPHYTHFLALIDAAESQGWTFEGNQSMKIHANLESVPAMVFKAIPGQKKEIIELLSFWCEGQDDISKKKIFFDAEAVSVFLRLGKKKTSMDDSHTFDDGHTMCTAIGSTNEFGFSFSMATTGFARLEIVPLSQVDKLEVKFEFWD